MQSLTQMKAEKARLAREIQSQTTKAGQIRSRINRHQKETAMLQARLKALIGAEPAKAPVKKPSRARQGVKKVVRNAGKVAKKVVAKKALVSKKGLKVAKQRSLTRKQLVVQALSESKKPLNINEIISALKAKHYSFKASNPRNALTVLLYTDKIFQKVKPGYFTMKK